MEEHETSAPGDLFVTEEDLARAKARLADVLRRQLDDETESARLAELQSQAAIVEAKKRAADALRIHLQQQVEAEQKSLTREEDALVAARGRVTHALTKQQEAQAQSASEAQQLNERSSSKLRTALSRTLKA